MSKHTLFHKKTKIFNNKINYQSFPLTVKMGLRKIYLANDAPNVYPPDSREARWGDERLLESTLPDEDLAHAKARYQESTEKFIEKFLPDSLKVNDKLDRTVFLRFHLHRSVIEKLLECSDAYGISINLAAKQYMFKDNTHTEPELGTTVIVRAVDENMHDLADPEYGGIEDKLYYEAIPSPCPPRNPCPTQLKFLPDADFEYSQS